MSNFERAHSLNSSCSSSGYPGLITSMGIFSDAKKAAIRIILAAAGDFSFTYAKFISQVVLTDKRCLASKLRGVTGCCFKRRTFTARYFSRYSVKLSGIGLVVMYAAACSRASGNATSSFAKQIASGSRDFP